MSHMAINAENTSIMDKTRELCEAIVADARFLALQGQVERFLGDDSSRLQYQSVHERGEELHHKQHAGVELSRVEIRDFEVAREALFENEVVRDFLSAQQELESLQKLIRTHVALTLELGRVPNDDDLAEANGGGCCGGGCGSGGGGCSSH
jgi:cell fate (sporulation/competence/biofilm development) regulator YlbF (YheA/YmcA/DUF963 family)